ncbi:hypothetical protein [Paenisporosarcina antarctica]|uniref:Uncharacterized protein n=1 Tax=Paenisporosarcina antarctica TaxID=417367 RepID=A0A4V1AN93_9BACL|nr:hypothetical protein [Paenisporosarcina antarctica]QBP41975.1 hypothetical protein E2636_12805 [Paenisporosarcina antarctica]
MGQLENIDKLESYIDELGTEIKHVKKASTYLREIEAQHLLVEKQLERVKQTTDALEIIQSHFTEKSKEFETQLKKNENRFKELSSTVVSSFSETEHYLKEQIGVIKNVSSKVGKDVWDLQSKTNLLEQQVVSMSSTVSTVNNSVIELQRNINQLVQRNLELKETVQQTNENQNQSVKRIEKISMVMTSILLIAIILIRIV